MALETVTPAHREALADILLPIADDAWIAGQRGSEWLGMAPDLEEDLALSSISQDALGHAQLLYDVLAELGNREADEQVYARPASGWRHCRLVQAPRQDWADFVARRYCYETFDDLRLHALAAAGHAPLQSALAKILQEKLYHVRHFDTWLQTLAWGGTQSRARLQEAMAGVFAELGDLFSWGEGASALTLWNLTALSSLRPLWESRVRDRLEQLGLEWPRVGAKESDGRLGEHGPEFADLLAEMTSVRTMEPAGEW